MIETILMNLINARTSTVLLCLLCALVALTVLTKVREGSTPKFRPLPLLNKSEARLYRLLRSETPQGWMLTIQTSYGSMLGCASRKRYMTINAKRADFVFCDKTTFEPIAVIEYQGSGHYGSSSQSRRDAERRDAQKRTALAEARLALIEVPAKYERQWIRDRLAEITAAQRSGSTDDIPCSPTRMREVDQTSAS